MKILSGSEIADYMKANQAHTVQALRSNKIQPKLIIIRNSDNPVITKYVSLKQEYGTDIGVIVEDWLREDVETAIIEANAEPSIHAVIVQLPLKGDLDVDAVLSKIDPAKDVDGLATAPESNTATGVESATYEAVATEGAGSSGTKSPVFGSATATAINWLLAGYDIPLDRMKIAIVGRGRLVGRPLLRMWSNSGFSVKIFHRGDDLMELRNFDLIVTATGSAHIIKSAMVRPGAVVVDAGTASEDGVLVGDLDDEVRRRDDLAAITPRVGGVGPLTVTALFEHVLIAAKNQLH